MIEMTTDSWSEFKNIVVTKKGLPLQFQEKAGYYQVLAQEGLFVWSYNLLKDGGADVTDFETSFKADANQPLEIRGSAGRPARVAASAQPRGTTEKWKGFSKVDTGGESSFTFDIGFDSLVYLRGGTIYSPDAVDGDLVRADGVLKASPTTVVLPNLLDTVDVVPGISIDFLSAEAMALAPEVMIRATYTKADTNGRKLKAKMDYFQ